MSGFEMSGLEISGFRITTEFSGCVTAPPPDAVSVTSTGIFASGSEDVAKTDFDMVVNGGTVMSTMVKSGASES